MREIDNNITTNVNFKGGIQPKSQPNDEQSTQQQAAQNEGKEIKDLSNMPAASLGKSQVSVDNINSDIAEFEKNPELTQKLNDIIDEYSKTHTQEQTLKFMDATIQEFYSKK